MLCVDPTDERKVIVKRLALCVEGRPDMELDLTGDLDKLKQQVGFSTKFILLLFYEGLND